MIHEHDAGGLRIERFRDVAAEAKPGTTVRHGHERVAEAIANGLLASAGVGERQDRVGVRMQHCVRRKKGVQQRLDRRPRAARIEQTSRQVVDHLLVGHVAFALSEGRDVVQAHRRKLLRRDRLHVAAAALDQHHRNRVAKEIGGGRFDAVVAAAPQHERLVRPYQT